MKSTLESCLHPVVYTLYIPGVSCVKSCLFCGGNGLFEPEKYEKVEGVYLSEWNHPQTSRLKTYDIYRRTQ